MRHRFEQHPRSGLNSGCLMIGSSANSGIASDGVRLSEEQAFAKSLWHKGLRARKRGGLASNRCPLYRCRWPANKTQTTCRRPSFQALPQNLWVDSAAVRLPAVLMRGCHRPQGIAIRRQGQGASHRTFGPPSCLPIGTAPADDGRLIRRSARKDGQKSGLSKG